MPADIQEHGRGALLTIGRGGWSIHYEPVEGSNVRRSIRSGYGDDWQKHADHFRPDAVVVDSTVIPEELIVEFACSGPMPSADVPAGKLDRLGAGLEDFNGRPLEDRPARLGNARALDQAAPDVYARIAYRYGARIGFVRTAIDRGLDTLELEREPFTEEELRGLELTA